MSVKSPGGALQCYLFNVAFAAASAEKDYAIYLPSGLLGGLRLPSKIITSSSYTINAMDSILIAKYTSGNQYMSLPGYPALGTNIRIINDARRGTYKLVIRGNNTPIETANGAGKNSVETSVRQVLEFQYDGECWHLIVSN